MYEQISMFDQTDGREPETITWNLWHGCIRVSTGCKHCYMFRRDEEVGKDPTRVYKTKSFNTPIEKYKKSGLYKIPSGSLIYTCFSSDFSITHEPMLSQINIKPYLSSPLWQRKAASGEMKSIIESVTCGGELGPEAQHSQAQKAGLDYIPPDS